MKKLLTYTLIVALMAMMMPLMGTAKAASMKDADADVVNLFTTRLSATVAASDTVLPVESITGFTVGDKIRINDGSADEEATISAIEAVASSKTITVDALDSAHDRGATIVTVYDAATSSNLALQFAFTNETYIPLLKTVTFDFTYEPEEAGTQNNFTTDGGDMTSAAKDASSGLPTAGTPTLTEDSDVLSYAYAAAQSLAADTASTFNVDQFNKLPDGTTTSEYPVEISLIEDAGNTIDTAIVWYSVEPGIWTQAVVDANLTYAAGTGGSAAPTNGSIDADSIDFAELYDGTAKTGTLEYTVSQNAADGYTVSVAGTATMTSADGDTIAADNGSNATPSAWQTINSTTTSGYGYHSSDELLGEGTTDRFAAADTFAAFATSEAPVAYTATATSGATDDADGLHTIAVKAEVDAMHPSGTYVGKIDLIVTPIY